MSNEAGLPLHIVTSCPLTKKEQKKKQLYPQEGEVPVVLDAGDLQVAHDYLAVFIVFA